MSDVKTVVVTIEETQDPDFKEPSRWFVQNAMGDMVYFCCQKREKAQQACDDMYGKGRYTIKTTATVKNKGDVSARGTNSRRGFTYLKKR